MFYFFSALNLYRSFPTKTNILISSHFTNLFNFARKLFQRVYISNLVKIVLLISNFPENSTSKKMVNYNHTDYGRGDVEFGPGYSPPPGNNRCNNSSRSLSAYNHLNTWCFPSNIFPNHNPRH